MIFSYHIFLNRFTLFVVTLLTKVFLFLRFVFIQYPLFALFMLFVGSGSTLAAGLPGVEFEVVEVVGRSTNRTLVGDAQSASVGTISREQLQFRPLSRPAEVLEAVPGMVVTQHSGEGKANQYFLRGFNLDHGTDFANYVEGIPINMVTHGHGQGYTDMNFLISELVSDIVYRKGPYYAQSGDFSSAGSAHIGYVDQLQNNHVKSTIGKWGYQRLLTMGSIDVNADSTILMALEGVRYDGPWQTRQELEKNNTLIKYSHNEEQSGYSVTLMIYDNNWKSTDQIPQRLVRSGELDRFGDLDPLTGGDTHRYSLSSQLWGSVGGGDYQLALYGVDYSLRLTTNATYFLDSVLSDRFTQRDERNTFGGTFSWRKSFNELQSLELGGSVRFDDISKVGFERVDGSISDFSQVSELGSAIYSSLTSDWSAYFSTTIGLRYNHFKFDVEGDNDPLNPDSSVDGTLSDGVISPTLSLRFGPWAETEYFVNIGQGIHSNDARGVVKPTANIDAAAKSTGAELGFRSALLSNVQMSVAVFMLDLDSELVFVGDDGTTEVRDATRRKGVELGVYYQPLPWLIVDVDAALSQARFKKQQYDGGVVLGRRVPDAMNRVFSLGVSMDFDNGVFTGVRARYFGPRDLEESGVVQSQSTFVTNANVGYRWSTGLSMSLEVLNIFDSKDDDITYYYESLALSERNQGLPSRLDKHSHPVESRNIRLSIEYRFQ